MKRNKDLFFIPYLILFTAVILMFINLFSLLSKPNIKLFEVTSPLIYCFIVAISLIGCLTYSFITESKKLEFKNEESIVTYEDLKSIVFYILGLIIYVLLLPILHFGLTTFIFVSTIMFLLNDSTQKITLRLLKSIISSGILVPLILYVFSGIFHVKLP